MFQNRLSVFALMLMFATPAVGGCATSATQEPPAPSKPKASGPTLQPASVFYEVTDRGKKVKMTVSWKVPTGWVQDTSSDLEEDIRKMIPAGADSLNAPYVATTAMCQGRCSQAAMAKKMAEYFDEAYEMAKDFPILREDRNTKHMLGYANQVPLSKGAQFLVMRWEPGWPRMLSCEGNLGGAYAKQWKALYDACAALKVSLEPVN